LHISSALSLSLLRNLPVWQEQHFPGQRSETRNGSETNQTKFDAVLEGKGVCVCEDSSNEPAPAEGEDSSGTDDAYVKHLGLFRDAMATLYEVKMDEGYAKALEADIVVLHEEIAAWKKLFSAMDSSDEEVRCVCPYCYAEGKCFVSKARAKKLEEQELMEESCPFGDNCAGEDSSED
jgi:hypothetical protein